LHNEEEQVADPEDLSARAVRDSFAGDEAAVVAAEDVRGARGLRGAEGRVQEVPGPPRRHEENFKAKEEDIRKRDLEIQIHLINFCQYLQENDSKRKKAEERFKQDLEVFTRKENDINGMP
jgi:hypothetical protein